ncbi:ABC transporter ATP-binding protein [Sinorhizobium mexicanum]|uniref:Spermidine/putrescine import ATP-binding protein PotA n=1 Tax=Sinorhizobium mexicanum TaxID=375549 RepID=A0A859QEX7_9HYPH|nr:ABC transporter ATP-binding protein [Sinorhizobium mexicanum]MBP1883903.1 spermidine/putrescine transport system ATP-binding protein [Sinorhizobium mexicanum]QLL64643.1 ABC transporter ATP-binding protein [Sinorhizobium mexicanum]
MQPVVHFKNVNKFYGALPAVENLDLAIETGQFVTLLGPSGCGKSTTLRMLGGFEEPTSGEIYLDGKPISHLPPNKRNVNIVFQDYALFPHLPVRRNIAFGLELKGMESSAIHKRVTELLALVGLQDYAERMPAQLSGGQRQRVALMRALAPDPNVLLLDEPLSALDAKLRQQMQIELKSIQQKTGKTFIFVTHDQEEALTMSDVIVVMDKGRIEQMGGPDELYARPRSRFVANFIGQSNFLEGKVVSVEGTVASFDWQGNIVQADVNGTAHAPGARATVALRPEALYCLPAKPEGRLALKGRIDQRVFKGAHTSLTVTLENGTSLVVQLDPVALSHIESDEVWVGWRERDAVLLAD